jgi:hypothetical protein
MLSCGLRNFTATGAIQHAKNFIVGDHGVYFSAGEVNLFYGIAVATYLSN